MYDLIIIGSGPAGLSAAVYGKRAGLNLLVLEKAPMSGGQVLNTYEVDNYLGMPGMNGFDMGMEFRKHADKLGVPFKEAEVISVSDTGDYKLIKTDAGELQAKTVILATGAQHAHLNVPGEEELYDLAELFKVFADSTRIKILYVLFESEMCVCDIAQLIEMSQSAISHQLRVLKQAKLVKFRREGKTVFYSLSDDHVRTMINQGIEHIKE